MHATVQIRIQLAEKELALLEKEKTLLQQEQTVAVLYEEVGRGGWVGGWVAALGLWSSRPPASRQCACACACMRVLHACKTLCLMERGVPQHASGIPRTGERGCSVWMPI